MRIIKVLLIAFAVSCLVLPAVAQEDPPTLSRGYGLKVKPGHDNEFQEAMKKQVDWYKKNNETWAWHTWQWETGPNYGEYIFRSPGHRWQDMDARSERHERAREHFMEVVNPHLEAMSATIGNVLADLSHWPRELSAIPMASVYTFYVNYGMTEEFNHVLKRIHKAIGESGYPVNYAWGTTLSGDEVGTYWLVVPHKNWADMKAPEKPFWKMMEETVGRQEADVLRASLKECVREEHSALARFRPELSYIPPEQ